MDQAVLFRNLYRTYIKHHPIEYSLKSTYIYSLCFLEYMYLYAVFWYECFLLLEPLICLCPIISSPDAYPKLVQQPHILPPIVEGSDFKLSCLVPYPPSQLDAIFTVTWLADGKQLPTTYVLSGTQRQATLYGDDLEGFMNSEISCQVVSEFTDGRANKTSPPWESNKYWAGIKVR